MVAIRILGWRREGGGRASVKEESEEAMSGNACSVDKDLVVRLCLVLAESSNRKDGFNAVLEDDAWNLSCRKAP